jgi:glycosyltransferase involved in cell wall biosynthesis
MNISTLPSLKIGYGIVLYNTAKSGVFKKISDQVGKWAELGAKPHLFVITDVESVENWSQLDCDITIFVDTNLISKIRNRFQLLLSSREIPIDLLYVRDVFPLFYPKLRVPIVIEIQTLYSNELSLRKKYAVPVYKFLSRFMYGRINAAVYVTDELFRSNEINLSPRIKKLVIGNGIELSRVQQLAHNNPEKLSLFFVGHPDQVWHGVDQLIKFAEIFPQIEVHLVGYKLEEFLPNVYSYGLLDERSYVELAARCVAGVASLNLTSIGMKEASPLKSREYLAMGLPVIARYSDPDFTPAPNFILELPQDSSTLESYSEEILTFLKYWSGKRVPRNRITHIDVFSKESIRLDFFKDVLLQFKSNYAKAGER